MLMLYFFLSNGLSCGWWEEEGREANVKPLQSVLSMIQSIVSKH